ncbi:E3 ubiquitin-protein ligase orthrus [Thalictrum thalictroides]|uniref:RING-type E3 ubiquitin transferase n=1 Tax=Thalictrum thalictroides TaxID=46969 RepID=A0A7J6X8F9_THATH|nr:E3 ubiquitin-protein ligase orthrus [Thalictrum thalictroides]
MAQVSNLPCDGEGICMLCKTKPSQEETLTCKTCITPWHITCLSSPPETLLSSIQWDCPDCSSISTVGETTTFVSVGQSDGSSDLIAAIRAIEADESLTEQDKAKQRQQLMSKGKGDESVSDLDEEKEKTSEENDVLNLLGENFNCSFCMKLPERPVTTPCRHTFCLKCFEKWISKGKRSCAKCRATIPTKMASQPRINLSLVAAIRMAKMSKSITSGTQQKVYHFVHNQHRPDKAFTTERAKKAGKANACSGKIFVTVPPDHFGPILAENDPDRKQGVLVGECWEDRMECRQWGAHLPHVAGIAGQSEYGAQSVALSGGYEDDEDHGEWFLYTGSGGRDLSGNKRTNKSQSFDQKFDKMNEALRVSCKKGYPVRVVRSHKEKGSSYAPEKGVRYDGVYRIEKCWRKAGIQGFKVCRYLFVRCDNEPAPWTSDEHGDQPRPLPAIKELKGATDVTERKEGPSWDYDEKDCCWKWKKPPPLSRKSVDTGNPEERKRARKAISKAQNLSVRERLLKEFSCSICRNVLNLPLTTDCGHNFCKPCLEGAFSGQTFVKERTCAGRRTLRAQKNVMKCPVPVCSFDISDFLRNPQVNSELMGMIESLQRKTEEENFERFSEEESTGTDEQSEMVSEENEIAVRQDAGKVVQNSATPLKHTYKRRKCTNESLLSKPDGMENKDESFELERVKPMSTGTGIGDNEMEGKNFTPISKSKLKANDGENTPIKLYEEVANEGSYSPSSPLHVRSDEDDDE